MTSEQAAELSDAQAALSEAVSNAVDANYEQSNDIRFESPAAPDPDEPEHTWHGDPGILPDEGSPI